MEYRVLGKTGLRVSEMGLGCAQIGGPSLRGGRMIGSPSIAKTAAIRILATAFDSGINFYDTAPGYGDGKSEEYIGEVFSNIRDRVIIATKCGMTSSGGRCFDKSFIMESVENSLKRLKFDVLDILQLRGPSVDVIQRGEIFDTLDELKKRGRIKFAGISTATVEDALEVVRIGRVDVIQVFYNLLYTIPENELLPAADAKGIGVICRSPLSSGLLTGKITLSTKFRPEDDRNEFMHGALLRSRLRKIEIITDELHLSEEGLRGLSLSYLLSNEQISSVIPGASSVEQLQGNIRRISKRTIPMEKYKYIKRFLSDLNKRMPL